MIDSCRPVLAFLVSTMGVVPVPVFVEVWPVGVFLACDELAFSLDAYDVSPSVT